MAAGNKSRDIRIVRVYDAPVKAVWEAWTDDAQVGQWWGPRGFTLTTHSKDLRPGGIWHYTMHGPDGTDYPNKTLYHVVEKHARLEYDHGGNDERAPLFRVTATFTEKPKGKTTLEMTMTLATPEAAEETRKFIRKAGGEATWDRLAEYLDHELKGGDSFVINRSFDVDLDTMYAMWTDPKHFQKWLPPTGMTMEFIRADIRPGGEGFYVMTGNGMKMWGKVKYIEMRKPDRLLYTQQFSDEHGGIGRHPMAPTWPETMLTTVELTSEDERRTRVTVTWRPHGKCTPEELDVFLKARAGMTGGWTGSFDKLEALLATG